MSYIDYYENLSSEEELIAIVNETIANSKREQLEREADEQLRKHSLDYIKGCDSKFKEFQSNAIKNKDLLLYVYATGILFLIMNCDPLEHSNDLSEIVKLMEIVPKDDIDKNLLLRIKEECYKLGHNVFDFDSASVLKARQYSIGDLLGVGVWRLRGDIQDDFWNNFNNET